MNLQLTYDRFMQSRIGLHRDIYTEKHHIIPKSLGGSNRSENIVRLTPREHFVAHKILAKIHKTRGMWFALVTMASKNGLSSRGFSANSREYEFARNNYSISLKYDHPSRGVKMSDEMRSYHSIISPRLSGVDHPMFGKKHNQTSLEKMVASSLRLRGSDHPMFGKFHTNSAKNKMSEKRTGLLNGRSDKTTITFIHTDGTIFIGTRYDFCIKYGFKRNDGSLSKLINNKIQSTRGWKINGTEI